MNPNRGPQRAVPRSRQETGHAIHGHRQSHQGLEAGVMPDEKLLTEMGKYNEELVKAGVMLAGEGLHPSSKGKRVRFSGSQAHGDRRARSPRPRSWSRASGCCRSTSMDEAVEWLEALPRTRRRRASSRSVRCSRRKTSARRLRRSCARRRSGCARKARAARAERSHSGLGTRAPTRGSGRSRRAAAAGWSAGMPSDASGYVFGLLAGAKLDHPATARPRAVKGSSRAMASIS